MLVAHLEKNREKNVRGTEKWETLGDMGDISEWETKLGDIWETTDHVTSSNVFDWLISL